MRCIGFAAEDYQLFLLERPRSCLSDGTAEFKRRLKKMNKGLAEAAAKKAENPWRIPACRRVPKAEKIVKRDAMRIGTVFLGRIKSVLVFIQAFRVTGSELKLDHHA